MFFSIKNVGIIAVFENGENQPINYVILRCISQFLEKLESCSERLNMPLRVWVYILRTVAL